LSESKFYAEAGVSVHAGYTSNEGIKEYIQKTLNKNVLSGLGGFSGLYSLKDFRFMDEPVLAFGTDGVGTKLKLAFLMDKHDSIGIDCVAMCVNDIICSGAKPLAFLDYYACGKNEPDKVIDVVKGVADGCLQAECALIGGETAEMPGFYPDGEYDLAGFAAGVVDKKDIIDGSRVAAGDVIIGIASSGVHSNGFSLVRKAFGIENERAVLDEYYEELSATLGETLLTPTKIYVKAVKAAVATGNVKAIANITGGGFYENIPRAYENLCAKINDGSWPVPPIFELMMKKGDIPRVEMFAVFNMGIGMVIMAAKENSDEIIKALESAGEKAYIIGEMAAKNEKEIEIC